MIVKYEKTPKKAIISVEDVSLKIPIYNAYSRAITTGIISAATGGLLHSEKGKSYVQALSNINCTIKEGERIGLIGHNGAGKSTFLRLISGIYMPSTGRVRASTYATPMLQRAFITSLDLTGFHAVKSHFLLHQYKLDGFSKFIEDIQEFSGLGEYMYMPMKTYSDGMRTRLMFALSTSLRHECIAIDEGFGAGDAMFFKRAQRRLTSFIESTGTLILATHSENLLKRFCSRGIIFSKGSIVYDSSIDDALSFYSSNYA